MTDIADQRECFLCKAMRPASSFGAEIGDRYYNLCSDCTTRLRKPRGGPRERLTHTATERTCYLCRRVLPVEQFTRRAKGTYFSGCKDCNRFVFAERRRTREKAGGKKYTKAEWDALLARHDRCPDCGRLWSEIPPTPNGILITADHIIPVLRGGTNAIGNIRPLCYSCNSKKGGS